MLQSDLLTQLVWLFMGNLPTWGVLAFGLFLWARRRAQRPRAANLALVGIVLLGLGHMLPIVFWQTVGQQLAQGIGSKMLLRIIVAGLSIPGALGLLCLLLAAFDTTVREPSRYDDWDLDRR